MKVKRLETSSYRILTDRPEADGTFHWTTTTLVFVEAVADSGLRGLGFSYTAAAAGELIHDRLEEAVIGRPVEHLGAAWQAMIRAVRNVGQPGVAATAISAVDIALWDLGARALELPLFCLLSIYRDRVPIYGSGGFTTYSEAELIEQFTGRLPRWRMHSASRSQPTRPPRSMPIWAVPFHSLSIWNTSMTM